MPRSTFLLCFFPSTIQASCCLYPIRFKEQSPPPTLLSISRKTHEHSAGTAARSWVLLFLFGCGVGQDFFLSMALPFMGAQRCYSGFKLGDLHHNRFVGIWLNLNEVVIVYEMSTKSWLPSSPLLDALEKAAMKDKYTSILGFLKELLEFFCFGFWYLVWEDIGLEQKSWPCKQIKTTLESGTTLLNPSKLKKTAH